MRLKDESNSELMKSWYKDIARALGVASLPLSVMVALIAFGGQIFGTIPELFGGEKTSFFFLFISAVAMICSSIWKAVLEIVVIYVMRFGLETGKATFQPLKTFFQYPAMVRRVMLWGIIEGVCMWLAWSFVFSQLTVESTEMNYLSAVLQVGLFLLCFLIWIGVSLTTLFVVDANMPLGKALFYSILTIKRHLRVVSLTYGALLAGAMGVFMIAVMLASLMPVLAFVLIPLPSFLFLLCNMLLHWPIYRDVAGARNEINLNATPLERV